MKKSKKLNIQRKRRSFRVSNAVKRYSTRPRLCVFRSNKHIYAQIVDDAAGKTLCSAGTNDKDLREAVGYGGNCAAAAKVGEAIAQKAVQAGVTQVAFDRNGFKYHGRLKSLADAARQNGLDIGAMPTEEEMQAKAAKRGTTPKKVKQDPVEKKKKASMAGSKKK